MLRIINISKFAYIGIAGKLVDGLVQTIFGLDPAGLLFSINSPLERFHEDDALYTEGIRTNAGNLGFDVPLGQTDFYPNWGSRFVANIMNLNHLNEPLNIQQPTWVRVRYCWVMRAFKSPPILRRVDH